MWRSAYLPARQIADQLRQFVNVHESAAAAAPGTAGGQLEAAQAAALTDAGFVLGRLKEQLIYENRHLASFAVDFVSAGRGGAAGLQALLRSLVVLQRLLNAGPHQSTIGAFISRAAGAAGRRRKAAVAEADCLECIKLLLEKTNSWAYVLDYPGNIELILFSLNSPQLDSKCYALEISTMLLRQASGFLQLLRSLTVSAATNRDENRLTPVVAQLKHGLNTGKLHIQILVVRFLNVFRTQAPSENYGLLVQIEAENAGFSADRMERILADHQSRYGTSSGGEALQRELVAWRQGHTPISVLTARRQMQRDGLNLRPSIYSTRHNAAPYMDSPEWRGRPPTTADRSQRRHSFDNNDYDLQRRWSWRRESDRSYDSRQPADGRARNAPPPVERHKLRRGAAPTPGPGSGPPQTGAGDSRSLGRTPDWQYGQAFYRVRDCPQLAASHPAAGADRSLPRKYNRSDSIPVPVTRTRSEASMQRYTDNYDDMAPAQRHAQFRSASVTPLERGAQLRGSLADTGIRDRSASPPLQQRDRQLSTPSRTLGSRQRYAPKRAPSYTSATMPNRAAARQQHESRDRDSMQRITEDTDEYGQRQRFVPITHAEAARNRYSTPGPHTPSAASTSGSVYTQQQHPHRVVTVERPPTRQQTVSEHDSIKDNTSYRGPQIDQVEVEIIDHRRRSNRSAASSGRPPSAVTVIHQGPSATPPHQHYQQQQQPHFEQAGATAGRPLPPVPREDVATPSGKTFRMAGFSYLFPDQPVTDAVPIRSPSSSSAAIGQGGQRSAATSPIPGGGGGGLSSERQGSGRAPSPSVLSSSTHTSAASRPPVVTGGVASVQRHAQPTPPAEHDPRSQSAPRTHYIKQQYVAARPRSAPVFDDQQLPSQQMDAARSGHVMHIPVHRENVVRNQRRGPSGSYAYTEDVDDALSKFDYLNDYETSSRGSRYGQVP